jgi:DnaJ family protein C protein 19
VLNLLAALAVAWIGWRVWKGFPRPAARPPAPPEAIEVREARALLGVSASAGAAEIRAAHRRLVAEAHPDRGGSPDLAGRLNAARDMLLRGTV